MTYDEAQTAAPQHRSQRGDDVIRHNVEDCYLVCDDCDWGIGYDEDAVSLGTSEANE